ncbi:MAG: hypothetical protein KC505_11055 [Myxococcales bacterium]|nr:hypothetical protein [Myxococcales bacterium]USN50539.1 MAG: hypothetical protein H6731_09790 [Myxococcales bacterium]
MQLRLFIAPLAICTFFLGANLAYSETPNNDENTNASLSLDEQAADSFVYYPGTNYYCYLYPYDPSCYGSGYYPYYDYGYYGSSYGHHRRGHDRHHRHHRRHHRR